MAPRRRGNMIVVSELIGALLAVAFAAVILTGGVHYLKNLFNSGGVVGAPVDYSYTVGDGNYTVVIHNPASEDVIVDIMAVLDNGSVITTCPLLVAESSIHHGFTGTNMSTLNIPVAGGDTLFIVCKGINATIDHVIVDTHGGAVILGSVAQPTVNWSNGTSGGSGGGGGSGGSGNGTSPSPTPHFKYMLPVTVLSAGDYNDSIVALRLNSTTLPPEQYSFFSTHVTSNCSDIQVYTPDGTPVPTNSSGTPDSCTVYFKPVLHTGVNSFILKFGDPNLNKPPKSFKKLQANHWITKTLPASQDQLTMERGEYVVPGWHIPPAKPYTSYYTKYTLNLYTNGSTRGDIRTIRALTNRLRALDYQAFQEGKTWVALQLSYAPTAKSYGTRPWHRQIGVGLLVATTELPYPHYYGVAYTRLPVIRQPQGIDSIYTVIGIARDDGAKAYLMYVAPNGTGVRITDAGNLWSSSSTANYWDIVGAGSYSYTYKPGWRLYLFVLWQANLKLLSTSSSSYMDASFTVYYIQELS